MKSQRRFAPYKKHTFDYFKKLLSPALAIKWQLIVEEEVVGVKNVSLTGTQPGLVRGRDFTSFSSCYFRFVKLVTPQDAAECLCRYMTIKMVLNTEKGITTKQGLARFIEMNKVLPLSLV